MINSQSQELTMEETRYDDEAGIHKERGLTLNSI
jgi:hypothetical protein